MPLLVCRKLALLNLSVFIILSKNNLTMNKLLLPLVAVGGAAAQAITALPQLNNAAVFAAVNTNDPEYELCTLANNYLELCISSLGGNEGLATASPDELLGCACCISSTALSEAFSTCSSYLSAEEPTLSSEYQAYGTLYSACSMTSCGGASRPSSTAEGKDETITTSLSASGFASGSASASASGALSSITQSASLDDTVEPACTDMIGLYQSCLDKDTGFSTWAYQDQAACYWFVFQIRALDGRVADPKKLPSQKRNARLDG
jgi:hypothetical protein